MFSLYHSFLVSFFLILRMVITLYIYSVHERMKVWMKKTTIYQFEDITNILYPCHNYKCWSIGLGDNESLTSIKRIGDVRLQIFNGLSFFLLLLSCIIFITRAKYYYYYYKWFDTPLQMHYKCCNTRLQEMDR